jgi:hypothetical protein
MNEIKLDYKEEAEKKLAQGLDDALPFLSRQTRNLLIKELKDIKNKLMILEMKQKRIEEIYKLKQEVQQ